MRGMVGSAGRSPHARLHAERCSRRDRAPDDPRRTDGEDVGTGADTPSLISTTNAPVAREQGGLTSRMLSATRRVEAVQSRNGIAHRDSSPCRAASIRLRVPGTGGGCWTVRCRPAHWPCCAIPSLSPPNGVTPATGPPSTVAAQARLRRRRRSRRGGGARVHRRPRRAGLVDVDDPWGLAAIAYAFCVRGRASPRSTGSSYGPPATRPAGSSSTAARPPRSV